MIRITLNQIWINKLKALSAYGVIGDVDRFLCYFMPLQWFSRISVVPGIKQYQTVPNSIKEKYNFLWVWYNQIH